MENVLGQVLSSLFGIVASLQAAVSGLPANHQNSYLYQPDVLGAATQTYTALTDTIIRNEPAAPPVGGITGAGSTVLDPDYRTKITRVTDGNTDPDPWSVNKSFVTSGGSFENTWNSDSDVFWVNGPAGAYFFKVDPSTQQVSKLLKPGGSQLILPASGPFSYSKPNTVYTRSGSVVKEYNVSNFSSANVFDIALLYPALSAVASQSYVPSASHDDTKISIAFGGNQDAYPYIIYYDRSVTPAKAKLLDTGYRGSCPTVKPKVTIDGAATTEGGGFGIHSAYLDRSGRYVILSKGACRYATDKSAEWAVWDTQTGSVSEFDNWSGHDVAGFGTRINQSGSDGFCSFYDEVFWINRPLGSLDSTAPLVSCENTPTPHPGSTGGHWSWANARADLSVPIVGTIDRNSASASAWRKWDNEILAVSTDGSGKVWRFAHTFSDWRVGGNFWDSARGNVSPDGRWFIFTSNWQKTLGTDPGGNARQDVFLIDLFSTGAPASDTSAPATPSNLSATAVSSSQINLSWSASTDNIGVAGYRIYRNGSLLATTASTDYSNTGLSVGTSYSYTISAYDSAGNASAQSAAVSAVTQAEVLPPAPPQTDKFQINDRVRTTAKLKVRKTPTTSGKALCTQPKGAWGSIIGGPQTASGYTWWQVNYDSSCDGWSAETWLIK